MRLGILVAGIVLVIIGAALTFVPVVPQGSQTVRSNSTAPYYAGSISGFSLTGSIPVSVSWTASSDVEIVAVAASCDGAGCSNATQISGATLQSGTSGSFTLDQPDGGSIIMGVVSTPGGSSANATFKITTAVTTVGAILAIVGIILVIVGAVVRKGRKATTVAPAPTAWPAPTDGPTTAPPTPPAQDPPGQS